MSVASSLQKLSVLRKKLDLMGYHEPLPLESVPLVAQLFHDFLQMTETMKCLKVENSEFLKMKSSFEDNVEPYREENCRLINENNDLHKKILTLKEEKTSSIRALKEKEKATESENTDLRFLNAHYLQKLESLEKISQERSEMIVLLQEKKAQPVVQSTEQTPLSKKDCTHKRFCSVDHRHCTFRRQRMEISNTLPPSDESFFKKIQEQAKDPYIADMMKISGDAINKLLCENRDLLEATEKYQKIMESLKEQVELRNQEIERLTTQLSAGRPFEAILSNTKEKKKDCIIENLTLQIEELHNQNEELEKTVVKLGGKDQLHHPHVLPRILKSSPDMDAKQNKPPSTKQKGAKEFCGKTQKHRLDEDLLQQVQCTSASCLTKINQLEKALKLCNLDKSRYQERNNVLLVREKKLQSEIDQLSKKSFHVAPSKSVERLKRLVYAVEKERDLFKQEYQALKQAEEFSTGIQSKALKKRFSDSKTNKKNSKDVLPEIDKETSILKLLEEQRDLYKEIADETKGREKKALQEDILPEPVVTADKEIMVIDNELENLRLKNFELSAQIRSMQDQITEFQVLKSQPLESEKQMIERENLEKAVAQLQNKIEELQNRIETTLKEKQYFIGQYQKVASENTVLQRTLMCHGVAVTDEKLAQSLQNADIRVPVLYTEEDIQEKSKVLTKKHSEETNSLLQQIEQLQNALIECQKENDSYKECCNSYKDTISSLNEHVASLKQQLSVIGEESNQHKLAVEHIRLMADHGDQSIEELQQSLLEKQIELKESETKILRLESDIEELNDVIFHHKKEILELRSTLAALEEDKHHLNETANQSGLQISSLQQQMYSKEIQASELKITVSAFEAQTEKLQATVRERNKEISILKLQLEDKSREIEELSRSHDILKRENARLLEEGSILAKDNQILNQELENKIVGLDEVKLQVREYVTEVARIQELLSIKEKQRSEIIQQYQNLSFENNSLETKTEQLQLEASATQMEMQAKNAELQQCHDTITSLEQEIEEYMNAQDAQRLEMTLLNGSMSGLEAELQHKQQEIENLNKKFEAFSSHILKLESSNTNMQKMLANQEDLNAKISAEMDDAREEIRALRAQLSSERSSVMNMESLMVCHREKDFRNHLTNQELNAEVSLLRERLQENTEKIEILSKDLASHKTKISELELEKGRLQRELTNEKYERERANNEFMRLHRQRTTTDQTQKKSLPPFLPSVPFATVSTSVTAENTLSLYASSLHKPSEYILHTVSDILPLSSQLNQRFGTSTGGNDCDPLVSPDSSASAEISKHSSRSSSHESHSGTKITSVTPENGTSEEENTKTIDVNT